MLGGAGHRRPPSNALVVFVKGKSLEIFCKKGEDKALHSSQALGNRSTLSVTMTARPMSPTHSVLPSLDRTDLDILNFRIDLGRRYGEPAALIRADLRCLAWSLSNNGTVEGKHASLPAWIEHVALC